MTAVAPTPATPTRRRRRVLLLVFDGMRPGSIDARRMPNLAALAARGVTFTRSRTGFPSETMVGAGELMSGAYPERSGITSNWMPVPGSDSHGVELKSLRGIEQVRDGFGGRALASTSIFQALAGAGQGSGIDLFYSTAVPDDAFVGQVRDLAGKAGVRFHLFVTPRDGFLTLDRLAELTPDWIEADIWFCGPAAFGKSLYAAMTSQGLPGSQFH